MRGGFRKASVLLAAALVGGIAFVGPAFPADEPPSNPFTFALGVSSPTGETGKRFDVLSGGGDWTFLVTVTGNVNTLIMSIRDSSPGDFCWFWSVKRPKGTFPVTAAQMPAAVLNACPGNQYPDSEPQLAFYAAFQGGRSGGVTITAAYPPQ